MLNKTKNIVKQTVTEQNIIEPMIGSLRETVQDPDDIIQEHVSPRLG